MDTRVIDAEFAVPCTQTRQYRTTKQGKSGGCNDKVVPKTIGTAKIGYPLWQKMTSFDANGKETFSTMQEVVEMSKSTLDPSFFEAPADYREVADSSQIYATSGTSGFRYGALPQFATSSSTSPSSGMTASVSNYKARA